MMNREYVSEVKSEETELIKSVIKWFKKTALVHLTVEQPSWS